MSAVADAVFLDLPHPWLAIHHAIESLKITGGRICSFSPCIEQVQKTCDRLRELRCVEVTTFECLERPYEVKKVHLVKQNAGADKHPNGIEYFVKTTGNEDQKSSEESMQEDDKEVAEVTKVEVDCSQGDEVELDNPQRSSETGDDNGAAEMEGDAPDRKQLKKSHEDSIRKGNRREKPVLEGTTRLCAIPTVKIPGHTGYLTFATYLGRSSEVTTDMHV